MSKIDPYVRLSAQDSGETKCVIFVDSLKDAREKLEKFTSTIVASYPFISGFGAHVSVHQLEDLSNLDCVRAVSGHTTVTTCLESFPSYFNAGFETAYAKGVFGKGVTAAIIDTGLRPHMDLLMPSYRVGFVDLFEGKSAPYDDNGHGTAVASILCGNGLLSNGKFRGVAPQAGLIALKAIDAKGNGGAFKILEAMQWVFTNREKYNIRVLCMSFGSEPILTGIDPLSIGAETLWRSGVVVVASAGNAGPEAKTIKSPGCNPYIITVGGAQIGEGESVTVADFSSRGPANGFTKPDLIAPSVNIACCGLAEDYTALSGTSMAAPIVAGAAALMLAKNPALTPDRVKELLLQNAAKIKIDPNAGGRGLLDLSFFDSI